MKLLALIQKGGTDTFGSENGRHYLNKTDLFQTGDTFTFSNYAKFLSKSGRNVTTMDNGETFPWKIDFESVTLDNDDAFETFEFDLPIVAVANPETVVATYSYYLSLDEEATEVTPVREYIDAGLHPEAIAFDEAPAKVAAIAQAKVYKVECEGGFYNPTTGDAIATPTTWLKYFPVGQETDYVTATAVYQEVVYGEQNAVFGKVVKDGVLYDFTNVASGAITDTLTATAGTGSDIWVDAVDKTIGAANVDALWADFIATDRKESYKSWKVGLSNYQMK